MLTNAARICCLLLLPMLATLGYAQSLGDELILSRLGDPVEVEIAVRDWQGVDLKQVQISNASAQQYAAFDLTYLPILQTLSFNLVGPNRAGEVKILVSSRDPVSEPFMDLLLVLRWPEGSSLREYVLLFDPPLPEFEREAPRVSTTTASDTPAVIAEPPAADSTVASPAVAEPATARPSTAATPTPVDHEPPVAAPVMDKGRVQYQVQGGETLWDVAQQFNPAGVSNNLYQFLISAHSLNRGAFNNGGIASLKAGAVLSIPNERDIAAVNPGTAQEVFERLWGPDVPKVEPETPAFASLDEPVAAPAPTPTPEPQLPLGTEQVVAPAATGLSLPNTAPVVVTVAPAVPPPVLPEPAVDEPAAVVASAVTAIDEPVATTEQPTQTATLPPVPSIQVVPQRIEPAVAPSPDTGGNPFLAGITQSATNIRDMLSGRQQRMAALEQQIIALQQQMQQAQERAQSLNQGLQSLSAPQTREVLLLGGLAAFLLLAFGVTVKLGLQWNREVQQQTRTLQAARNARQPPAVVNRPAPAATGGSAQNGVNDVLDFLRVEPTLKNESSVNPDKMAG